MPFLNACRKLLLNELMDFGFLPGFTADPNFGKIPETLNQASHKPKAYTMAAGSNPQMDAVPVVDIDKKDTFKYILLKMWARDHKDEDDFKFLVRGYQSAEYHADIYDDVYKRVSPLGLDLECVGGGRILHEPDKGKLFVYGYSQGFGRADHSTVCDLLKKKYPQYTNIDWSNDGY